MSKVCLGLMAICVSKRIHYKVVVVVVLVPLVSITSTHTHVFQLNCSSHQVLLKRTKRFLPHCMGALLYIGIGPKCFNICICIHQKVEEVRFEIKKPQGVYAYISAHIHNKSFWSIWVLVWLDAA